MTIFTFGHSTLSAEAALRVLDEQDVSTLVDVRSHPTSKWEQWQIENLKEWCETECLDYVWMPELGGWDARHLSEADKFKCYGVDVEVYAKGKFPKQRIGKKCCDLPLFEGNGPKWTNQGLWDYQFFMTLPEFKRGIDQLVERFDRPDEHCAIMCCELLWWKCHRSMIADYLTQAGVEVVHLQPKLTPHVKALGNRLERYHGDVTKVWEGWL